MAHIKMISSIRIVCPNSIPKCSVEGCKNKAQQGGICITHGGKEIRRRCSAKDCTKLAQKDGVCITHGAKVRRYICTSEGCTNWRVRGGFCKRHSADKDKVSDSRSTGSRRKPSVSVQCEYDVQCSV